MFDLIEKISRKAERKRRVFTISLSLGITLVIFIVWLSVILPTAVREEMASTNDLTPKTESPIRAFGRNTAQAFTALKEQLTMFRESMKMSPSVYNAATSTGSSTEPKAVVY